MSKRHVLAISLATLFAATSAFAQDVKREEVGNRISENVPTPSPALVEQLARYQNTRGAGVNGWIDNTCMLISTRFAETSQIHRLCAPMGMREQLTFYPEPIGGAQPFTLNGRKYFLFSKDIGGNENAQIYKFDLTSRDITMLTDGTSRNGSATLSKDGRYLAYSSNARNKKDMDIYLLDLATANAKPKMILSEGGSWGVQDFSFDGKELAVSRYNSIEDAQPAIINLSTGKINMLPVDGGKASFGGFVFDRSNKGAFFISNEPINGKVSEFRTLRHHDGVSNKVTHITATIPWDAESLTLSDDGKLLAYQTNEGGINKLYVRDTVTGKQVKLPALPTGLIGGTAFSPDGKRLALSLNSAASPSDVYVIDLATAKSTRWTQSEVGGLDTSKFIAPSLIEFPSFDGRKIPSFYYKPQTASASHKVPVIINIHGGPEAQSQPSFNPTAQYLANEKGVAMLIPNVRGSSGYGRTYLALDNGPLREDSVKDIGALLDWIAKQPELDASRVGVMGGSYGGYMVLSSLMHYSDRIRAGVDVVGISNFKTFLTNTESYRRDLRRAEYGDERDPVMSEVFDRISPLNHANRIKSPLFVAQGLNDPRVPYTEAEQIVKAVRGNGVPVSYLLFKDEGHGFRKKSNSDFFNAATMEFWDKYLIK